MIDPERNQEALEWQIGVWNRISNTYVREIDRRLAPVVEAVIKRAWLMPGKSVLDLGTGTAAVAERAAAIVGARGRILAVDPSPDMLILARNRMAARGLANVTLREGRAEAIPAEDQGFDVVLSSLTLMYVMTERPQPTRSGGCCARVDG